MKCSSIDCLFCLNLISLCLFVYVFLLSTKKVLDSFSLNSTLTSTSRIENVQSKYENFVHDSKRTVCEYDRSRFFEFKFLIRTII